jgi:hypothetical protein
MSCSCLVDAAEKSTDCECPVAGWCNRHNMTKTEHLHRLCRTDGGYFGLWEKGVGPAQIHPVGPRRVGLGDVIAWIADKVGIKPWKDCGCEDRRKWLNRFTVWGWWRAT